MSYSTLSFKGSSDYSSSTSLPPAKIIGLRVYLLSKKPSSSIEIFFSKESWPCLISGALQSSFWIKPRVDSISRFIIWEGFGVARLLCHCLACLGPLFPPIFKLLAGKVPCIYRSSYSIGVATDLISSSRLTRASSKSTSLKYYSSSCFQNIFKLLIPFFYTFRMFKRQLYDLSYSFTSWGHLFVNLSFILGFRCDTSSIHKIFKVLNLLLHHKLER